jgi:hypothetical protein
MALYYDLPVYRDTYQLILKIFEVTKDFLKDYKYTLGQDMKRDALQLVRSLMPDSECMEFLLFEQKLCQALFLIYYAEYLRKLGYS